MRLGVIGAGRFTNRILLPAYKTVKDLEIAALADIDGEAAGNTADAFGIPAAFNDPQALLASGEVDAVHIAVPPVHSPDLTEAAISAGLHVISEKPIATSVERARDLFERARAAGIVHAVDHEMRYDPVMGKMRQLVADGFIGEPRLVNVNAVLSVGIMPDSPLRFRTWYDSHTLGGGFSQMVLSHIVDLTRSLFGDFEPLTDTSAMTVPAKPSAAAPDKFEACAADDVAVVTGRLPSGGVAVLSGSWAVGHGAGMAWDVRGSEGTLVLDRDGTLRGGGVDQPLDLIGTDRSIVTSLASGADWLPLISGLAEDFVRAIRGESGPFNFSTFEDGARVCECVAAIGARHADAHRGKNNACSEVS